MINIGSNNTPVYLAQTGNYVDAIVRAPDLATFEAAATAAELLVDDGNGGLRPSDGVHIDHIGAVVVTPGTYGEDGSEITAPVLDARHHANIRIGEPALSVLDDGGAIKWHTWAMAWTAGTTDPQSNASEQAAVLHGVALIDPETINSPSRVWAG